MQCENCSSTNRSIARYCKRCGKEIVVQGHKQADQINMDFEGLIGLDDLKKTIQREVTAFRNMKQAGVQYDTRILHTMLMGSSGTGKNKVVDVLSKVFFKNGITSKSAPKEISAATFSEFSKNLAQNIDAAKGGILFIDNLHQLVPDGYTAGQSTPVDKLYIELDKRPGDPIVILAAKEDSFREYLHANMDVNNRFRQKFYLPEMTADDMYKLAIEFFGKKYNMEAPFLEKLRKRLLYLFRNQKDTAQLLTIGRNGFLVRKEVDNILTEHFANPSFHLYPATLREEDIKGKLATIKTPEEVLAELDDFVGMTDVKEFIRRMMNLLTIQRKDAATTSQQATMGAHMVITGNPGTGKTTLARKLGEVFLSAGVLSSGHVVETDRSMLIGQYIGETARLVQKYCNEAMGGILFVDEAYMLKQNDQDFFGQEAIDTLMKRMEDDRDKFIVIVAGYQKEMQTFIGANPGIKSRVKDNFFHLDDYTPDQLTDILKLFLRKEKYTLTPKAEERATTLLKEMWKKKNRDFGNGRDVRNLFDTIKINRANRLTTNQGEYNMEIIADDIPGDNIDISAEGIASLLEELNSLTGLREVKEEISQLIDFLEGQRIRMEAGGKSTDLNLHFVFTGNPGTGKTTVARILAKILKGLGFLPKGQLIEVTDKDLVIGYVGQTATNTTKVIDSAMGGVLFLDEAYTLAPKYNSFSGEALDTLLKRMEDDRGKFIVIAAGYTKEMQDFLNGNPGLRSRFSKNIHFHDYDPPALHSIMMGMIAQNGMKAGEAAVQKLRTRVEDLYSKRDKTFGNARTIRKEFTDIMQVQSSRLVQSKRNGLVVDPVELLPEDILLTGENDVQASLQELLHELDALTGLKNVKAAINSLTDVLAAEKIRANAGGQRTGVKAHFVFGGNPGTGKTTVARLLAKIFKEMGILPQGQLVEVTDKDLIAGYVGQTSEKTNKMIDLAMGGVLFIDEAYTLKPKPNSFASEAIDTLLKRMEDDRGKFIVIVAGYSKEMNDFMDSNPGLDSRFTNKITFDDYMPDELVAITQSFITNQGMRADEGAKAKITAYMEEMYRARDNRFANARTVRNFFETKIIPAQSRRLLELSKQQMSFDPMLITADDIANV